MNRQKLTVVCGNAGTGKTTLGKKMATDQGAALLDIDTVSERLVVAGLQARGHDPGDRDSAEYKATYREAIHETLFAIAEENLGTLPCVIVAPFTKERRDASFLGTLKARFQSPVEVVYVTCPDDVRKARIIERANPRDRNKIHGWDEYVRAGLDPGPPPFQHTLIDTSA